MCGKGRWSPCRTSLWSHWNKNLSPPIKISLNTSDFGFQALAGDESAHAAKSDKNPHKCRKIFLAHAIFVEKDV